MAAGRRTRSLALASIAVAALLLAQPIAFGSHLDAAPASTFPVSDCIAANYTLPFDGETGAILDDPVNGDVYVGAEGAIYAFNLTSQRIAQVVPVGALEPNDLALDPTNDHIFVTDGIEPARNVTVISGASNQVVANIPVGGYDTMMAFDSANGMLYVAGSGTAAPGPAYPGNYVTIVDAATDQVVGDIRLSNESGEPLSMALDPEAGLLFVTSVLLATPPQEGIVNAPGNVTVIDTDSESIETVITVGYSPSSVVVDVPLGVLFVANQGSNSVSVISTTGHDVVATIPLSGLSEESSAGMVFDPPTSQVLVEAIGSHYPGYLAILNASTARVVGNVSTYAFPVGVTSDPSGGVVFVLAWPQQMYEILPDGGCPSSGSSPSAAPLAYWLGGVATVAVLAAVVLVLLLRRRRQKLAERPQDAPKVGPRDP